MSNFDKKIAVIGVSASGKSVFSRELGRRLNIPVIYVDAIMWRPEWNYIGDEATVEKLVEASAGGEWVIEGYIEKGARPAVFERADTIIYLDYPRWVAAWRYVKRWWMHRRDPRPELEGSPEKFSFKFLKLVWTKGEAVSLNKFLAEHVDQNKIIRLTSPREARSFLSGE